MNGCAGLGIEEGLFGGEYLFTLLNLDFLLTKANRKGFYYGLGLEVGINDAFYVGAEVVLVPVFKAAEFDKLLTIELILSLKI